MAKEAPVATFDEIPPITPTEELPPLVISLTLNRNDGRLGFAHNIVNAEQDINMLIEAMSAITRDLNKALVDIRVQTALNTNGQEDGIINTQRD